MKKKGFDYEKIVWGGGLIRLRPTYFSARRLKKTLKAIKNCDGKLLDVGCGVGDYLEAISFYRPDLELFGLDVSREAIRLAKQRKIKAEFRLGRAEKLGFKESSFEVVTCVDLLEHVEQPRQVLKEIYRVLKPGGAMELIVPIEGNLWSLEGVLIRLGWQERERYGGHIQQFSIKRVKQLLREAGFEITTVSWGGHLLYQLVEMVYLTYLSIRGKKTTQSVEGYLATMKPGLKRGLMRLIKDLLAAVIYFESWLFGFMAGISMQVSCTKGKR